MIPSPCSFFSSGHLESILSVIFSTPFPFANQAKEGGVVEWVTHHLKNFKGTFLVELNPKSVLKMLQTRIIMPVFTKALCLLCCFFVAVVLLALMSSSEAFITPTTAFC